MSSSALVEGDLDGDASRPRSGILTPSSEGSLNRRHGGVASPSWPSSRRADAAAMDQLLKPSIAVKPHPHNLHVQPRTLLPLLLLPRQHLPLGSIDFQATTGDSMHNRFVESHIKILDLESRLGSTQSVLIARHEASGAVYALERQPDGLYVMCKLGGWVEPSQLAQAATAICHGRVFPARPESRPAEDSQAITTPQLHKDHKKKRAAIEAIQSLVRKKPKSEPTTPDDEPSSLNLVPAVPTIEPQQLQSVQAEAKLVNEVDAGSSQPAVAESETKATEEASPQDVAAGIFDNIRTHYFEALYKSMGSLAYFAKGPLSRARSAFHLDLEANLDMADLIDFLKSLILTTVQIDKKYRDTAPDLISKMSKIVHSSDEAHSKKRKSKKMKLGKDGLYPEEDARLCKWWIANKPELGEEQPSFSAAQIKSHLSVLRTRETQLQMIVILEILALEPLKAADEGGESSLPVLPGTSESQTQQASQSAQPKKRNRHNLPVLVDVHADRLTIWQSTATDEQLLLEDSQVTRLPIDGQPLQKPSSEPLKDFCTDVIIPFFSARLPELCDAINRKLGGPVIISPANSKLLKRSSSKKEQKPGTATKRPAAAKPQRTLQRALSTDQLHRRSVSRGPSNMIALMRSATSTSVPNVKREGSEPAAVRSIAKGEADASRKRTPLSRSNSVIGLADSRASKKALVEAQLKDAISALRKPNREVVGQAMAEAAEHRVTSSSATKKSRKGPRNNPGPSIVKATPANNRYKDVFAAKREGQTSTPMQAADEVIPPSSIGTFVPSTGQRSGFRNPIDLNTSPAVDTVGSTPTKPAASSSTFIRRPSNEEPFIPPSPLARHRKSGQPLAPATSTNTHLQLPKVDEEGVFETPAKKQANKFVPMESPVRQPQIQATPLAKPQSIYEKLGWDDDFDDL